MFLYRNFKLRVGCFVSFVPSMFLQFSSATVIYRRKEEVYSKKYPKRIYRTCQQISDVLVVFCSSGMYTCQRMNEWTPNHFKNVFTVTNGGIGCMIRICTKRKLFAFLNYYPLGVAKAIGMLGRMFFSFLYTFFFIRE